MPHRRLVLTLASGTFSGCLSSLPGTPKNNMDDGERERGAADPVHITQEVSIDGYEYVEQNDTIRYPAQQSGTATSDFNYKAFDEWAVDQANLQAKQEVRNHLDVPPGQQDLLVQDSTTRTSPPEVVLVHQTLLDKSGDIVREPPITTTEVVQQLPSAVTVTVKFEAHTSNITHCCYVKKQELLPSEH